MAEIKVKVVDKTPELMQRLEAAIGTAIAKTAGAVVSDIKTEMAEPKSGRLYPRGRDADGEISYHQASAAGEAPAIDSGHLVNSVSIAELSTLEAVVGTNIEYAAYLEHGTRRMAARPAWEPAAERAGQTLESLLTEEIAKIRR